MHLRKKSWGICLAVCMALTAVLCTYPRAQAAAGVNTEKTGNLTLALGAEDSDQMARDMARIEEPLQIHVWKLADMTEVGTYDFREAFQGLSTEGNDWKTLSEQAFGLVYGQEEGGVLSGEPRLPFRITVFLWTAPLPLALRLLFSFVRGIFISSFSPPRRCTMGI